MLRQYTTIFLRIYEMLSDCPGAGDWTKIHHKAQPPHEVSATFHCSNRMIFPSLFTYRNPIKLPQKVSNKLPLHNHFLVKTPLLLDFTMQVQLVKNTPKR